MSRPSNRIVAVCLALVMCGWVAGVACAQGEIILEEDFPVAHAGVRLHVVDDDGSPIAGANVAITYRPGSRVERSEAIGTTAEDGGLEWVPAEAGIARVTATWLFDDGSEASFATAVSVRFGSPPVVGIVIMIGAGLLLVVGSAIRMFNLLRSPEAP